MKNNYGGVAQRKLAVYSGTYTVTYTHPNIPSASADKYTEKEIDNSGKIVKYVWPSPYIPYVTHSLRLNFLLKVYSHLCREELKGQSQSISGLERLIPLGWENICPALHAPKGCLYFTAVQPRNKARQIGGTLHTISLPLPGVGRKYNVPFALLNG
jgi:hypothetical protein